MGKDAKHIRASQKFIRFLVEEYEKELMRGFTFPKATDRLLDDIMKMKTNELKRRRR